MMKSAIQMENILDEDTVKETLGEEVLEDMASRNDVFESIARDYDLETTKVKRHLIEVSFSFKSNYLYIYATHQETGAKF